jgi:uncharacterized protein (TIGR02246 family)
MRISPRWWAAGLPAGTLALAACVHVAVVRRPVSDAAEARAGVAAMLEHGAGAWNRGDLDGFISDYVPDATFVTGRGVVRGVAAIRERYAPRFGPGGMRDSLFFRDIEVDLLGPAVANAVAFYVLMRGDSVTSTGPTSLVVRRVEGRWRIVHDHSS